jgi:hypothetical protein
LNNHGAISNLIQHLNSQLSENYSLQPSLFLAVPVSFPISTFSFDCLLVVQGKMSRYFSSTARALLNFVWKGTEPVSYYESMIKDKLAKNPKLVGADRIEIA